MTKKGLELLGLHIIELDKFTTIHWGDYMKCYHCGKELGEGNEGELRKNHFWECESRLAKLIRGMIKVNGREEELSNVGYFRPKCEVVNDQKGGLESINISGTLYEKVNIEWLKETFTDWKKMEMEENKGNEEKIKEIKEKTFMEWIMENSDYLEIFEDINEGKIVYSKVRLHKGIRLTETLLKQNPKMFMKYIGDSIDETIYKMKKDYGNLACFVPRDKIEKELPVWVVFG